MAGDTIRATGTVVAEHRGDVYECAVDFGGATIRVLAKRSGRRESVKPG